MQVVVRLREHFCPFPCFSALDFDIGTFVRALHAYGRECTCACACVRACGPVYVGAASAAESELMSKIAEVNEKCARFYQDREDARDMLADSKAAVTSYKRALLAVKYALKTPVV